MSRHWTILNIRDGKPTNADNVRKLFNQLKDGKYNVDLTKIDKRSNQQNRYLHGVLIPEFRKALNSVGYDEVKTDEQSKEIMKQMFLKRQTVNKETGEVLEYVQQTRDLTKEENNILIEEVIKFCAENMSYTIPYPNEQLEIYDLEEGRQ